MHLYLDLTRLQSRGWEVTSQDTPRRDLEGLGFLGSLGFLGNLGSPENLDFRYRRFLGSLGSLGNLEFLVGQFDLGCPGFLVLLENLESLERLEILGLPEHLHLPNHNRSLRRCWRGTFRIHT